MSYESEPRCETARMEEVSTGQSEDVRVCVCWGEVLPFLAVVGLVSIGSVDVEAEAEVTGAGISFFSTFSVT